MRSLLVLLVLLLPAVSPAGDDVDYSAPYLVVEDGKLVTKYPAQEHETAATSATEPAARPPAESASAASMLQSWLLAGGVLGVLVGGLVVTTGRKV